MAKKKSEPAIEKPEDSEILADFAQIFKQDADYSQTIREVTWFRNILFYLGEQWISWYAEQNTFGSRFKLNLYEPTPVSNKIRDHVKSMKALILNKRYTARIWPNSDTQEDKDAAKLGSMALSSLDNENCNEVEDVKELIAMWVVLTGNAFGRTYANMDNGIYFKDAAGTVMPKGEVTIECLIPFGVVVPSLGVLLDQKRYVGIKCLKEKEWVEDTHEVLISAESENTLKVEYEKQLMTLVANVSPWKGRSLDQGTLAEMDASKLVLYQEVEYRPTKKYHKGRYAAVADGQVLENKTEMPIKVGKDGDWFYTVTDFKYNHTPGSFWATSGIDDLISPQKSINEIDKDLSANRQSLGRPYVLTPTDLVLKRQSLKGQSFLALKYEATQAYGAKPEVHKGTPYPEQILKERTLNIENIQDAAGDPKNILRGQAPSGQASGIMVDILRESAELGHTPDIERFFRSWNRVKKKQLIVAKDTLSDTRLIKMTGEGNEVIVKTFKGADLRDNTDVRMELDSGVSTTRAGQNQFIMKLIEQGFFGIVSEKPKVQYELLRRFGISWVPNETSVHEDRAGRENSMASQASKKDIQIEFEDSDNPVALLKGLFFSRLNNETSEVEVLMNDEYFRYDNDQVHYDSHTAVILSAEFQTWSIPNQMVLIGHNDMHYYQMEAVKQQEALALIQAQGGGAPPGPGGPGGPLPAQPALPGPAGEEETSPDLSLPGGGAEVATSPTG